MAKVLEASIDIDAPPEDVWRIVSDLKRMGEWSPQCRKMVVFGGDVRRGTRTLNVNRKGARVWPSSARVIDFEPNKRIAFRIVENYTVWSYDLRPRTGGTTVVERRESPDGISKFSQALIKAAMGGLDSFDEELTEGMRATLARIKTEAER